MLYTYIYIIYIIALKTALFLHVSTLRCTVIPYLFLLLV